MDVLCVHLRRPVVLMGLFALAALLVLLVTERNDARAGGQSTANALPAFAQAAAGVAPSPSPLEATSTQVLIESGTRALELGRYDEAIVYVRAALGRDPDSAVAHNLLGMAHRFRYNALRARRDKEREIEAFREAVRLDPGFVTALVNLGTSLWWDGRGEEGAPFLSRALALDPFHPDRDQLLRMIAVAVPAPTPPLIERPLADPPSTPVAPGSD